MIAALPMYDRPETQAANDRLWALIRAALADAGIPAPGRLTRGRDLWEVWTDPALVLAQTCGLPFRTRLAGRVTLIATPDYGVEGAPPGHYCSCLVVRADDPRERLADFAAGCLAFNDANSQSGWAAPVGHAAARGLAFARLLATGSHRASAHAVAEGRADIAGIDAVTWEMIRRWDPWAARLRVLETTAPTPGLPLIAAPGADRAATAAAVARAIAALDPGDRATLRLRGLVEIPAEAYLALPAPPPPPAAAA